MAKRMLIPFYSARRDPVQCLAFAEDCWLAGKFGSRTGDGMSWIWLFRRAGMPV